MIGLLKEKTSSAASVWGGTTHIWEAQIESDDGNWQTVGNWSTSAQPGDGDRVLITSSGSDDITAGLNNGADQLTFLGTHRNTTVNVGTTAAPLQIDAETVTIAQRAGSCHLKGSYTNVHLLDTPPADDAVTFTLPSAFGGPSYPRIDNLYVYGTQGQVTIDYTTAGLYAKNIYVLPRPGKWARVKINGGGGTSTTYLAAGNGAHITTANAGTTLDAWDNGRITLTGSAVNQLITVSGGGLIYHQSTGAITTLRLHHEGEFSTDSNEDDAFNLGSSSVSTYPDSILDIRNGSGGATVTGTYNNYGGTLLVDEGRTITAT